MQPLCSEPISQLDLFPKSALAAVACEERVRAIITRYSHSTVRLEQKSAIWGKGIVKRFCKTCQWALDPCVGRTTPPKAFKMFPKPQQFIGSQLDPVFFNPSFFSVVEALARYDLSYKSEIMENADVVEPAQTYLVATNKKIGQNRNAIWVVRRGMSHMQKF